MGEPKKVATNTTIILNFVASFWFWLLLLLVVVTANYASKVSNNFGHNQVSE